MRILDPHEAPDGYIAIDSIRHGGCPQCVFYMPFEPCKVTVDCRARFRQDGVKVIFKKAAEELEL